MPRRSDNHGKNYGFGSDNKASRPPAINVSYADNFTNERVLELVDGWLEKQRGTAEVLSSNRRIAIIKTSSRQAIVLYAVAQFAQAPTVQQLNMGDTPPHIAKAVVTWPIGEGAIQCRIIRPTNRDRT